MLQFIFIQQVVAQSPLVNDYQLEWVIGGTVRVYLHYITID